MTGFEAVGVFENASHPPFERSTGRPTIPAQTSSGKRKDGVPGDLLVTRKSSLSSSRRKDGYRGCEILFVTSNPVDAEVNSGFVAKLDMFNLHVNLSVKGALHGTEGPLLSCPNREFSPPVSLH